VLLPGGLILTGRLLLPRMREEIDACLLRSLKAAVPASHAAAAAIRAALLYGVGPSMVEGGMSAPRASQLDIHGVSPAPVAGSAKTWR